MITFDAYRGIVGQFSGSCAQLLLVVDSFAQQLAPQLAQQLALQLAQQLRPAA